MQSHRKLCTHEGARHESTLHMRTSMRAPIIRAPTMNTPAMSALTTKAPTLRSPTIYALFIASQLPILYYCIVLINLQTYYMSVIVYGTLFLMGQYEIIIIA